jgi:ribosomal-protein-alanine N-acetyltransferase
MYYFIEPMAEEDIAQVQEIERASFPTPWSPNTYRRELRNPTASRYIVARASTTPPPPSNRLVPAPQRRSGLLGMLLPHLFGSNGAANSYPLVGYGGLWLTLEEAHITTIAVAPEYRGQGIGELLLTGLIDQALDMQATTLTLEVRVSNVVAQSLYLKYGFQPVGKRPRYYTDNGEDALIMSTQSIRTPEYQQHLGELHRQLFVRLRAQADGRGSPTDERGRGAGRNSFTINW